MVDKQDFTEFDLVIVHNAQVLKFRTLGNFYDTNDGMYYYQDLFENAENKESFINGLNPCEFLYLLFFWSDQECAEIKLLSAKSMDKIQNYRAEGSPELSNDFFEFVWYNSFCEYEDIFWNKDYQWGIACEGELIFLLNTEWEEHNLYVKEDLFDSLTRDLIFFKHEIFKGLGKTVKAIS